MNGRNNVSWKAALVPAAVLTAALAAGIGHFAGGSGDAPAGGAGPEAFKFDSGPKYAPGSSPLARTEQQSGSSIDLFRKVNENYSAETAAPAEKPLPARRTLTKSELQEFMRQQRAAMDIDPEALAAAAGEQGGQPQAGNIYAPAQRNGSGGATAAAVRSRQPGEALRLQPASASQGRRSAFSIGSGSSMSRGGSGARRQRDLDQATESSTGESGAYSSGSQGGRNLSAGEYGSHGGGQSAAQAAQQSAQNPGTTAGGPAAEEKKREPMPVAFVWPRSLDFGKMYNYETAAHLVIIMNIGDAELRLGKIENMDDGTPFYLEKNKCSGAKLAPKKSCTFRVRFSPKASKTYYTGFAIGSNDSEAMDYQTYIEAKGESKYSYLTWWWRHNWSGDPGYSNRMKFNMVPEGYSMDEVLRVYNNSGQSWHRLKLDLSRLPGSFKIVSDKCTGQELHPHQSCALTVNFVPDAATNRKFCPGGYGQYHSFNLTTDAKLLHARPHFPPLVMDKPVEAYPKGEIRVLADYEEYYNRHHLVLTLPVSGKSCAPFPVYGLERVQHYFYFR
ncbi:MAG: choice-of-anchor D domain-containing protein [Elusimicrobiales bacterium]